MSIPLPKPIEDILGITDLKAQIVEQDTLNDSLILARNNLILERNDAWSKISLMDLQYRALSTQLNATMKDLKDCKALTDNDRALIAGLQEELASLKVQLEDQPSRDIYLQPTPAILQCVEPSHVILADFVITTAQGQRTYNYPDHPSFIMPCPVYENVLTQADCNRRRNDLTSIQICKAISNALQMRCTYITDSRQWGRTDNWPPPVLTAFSNQDDCENLAANIVSAITYYQLKFGAFNDCSVYIGFGHLNLGNEQFGHGFVVVLDNTKTDLSSSYIIEATDAWASPPMKISDVKDKYDCSWGLIGYVSYLNPDGTYSIRNSCQWWGPQAQEVSESVMANLQSIVEGLKSKLGLGVEARKQKALEQFSKDRNKEATTL